jgi:hypothetical protein
MADTAFMNTYRQEFIAGFEQSQALVRNAVTTEATVKGNQAIFLVADSGNASTTTRGVNGRIQARSDNLNQYTCILEEHHDLVNKTGFNVFASQGDQIRIMQETSMGVVNRRIEDQIITELNTATNDTGTATTASLALASKARAILGNNAVPITDGQLTAVISPAFEAYLIQSGYFSSSDFVGSHPLAGANAGFENKPKPYTWMNCNWIVSTRIPGLGTNAEKCFMFHRSAIGHAVNVADIQTAIGYDDEQDYSFCRTSFYGNAKLLQNSGVVVMNHDASALAAQ